MQVNELNLFGLLTMLCETSTHELCFGEPWFSNLWCTNLWYISPFLNPAGCPACTFGQLRAVHDVSGTNLFVQSRRYGCFNPGCPKVKECCAKWLAKKERKARESGEASPDDVQIVEDNNGQELTQAEVNSLRKGELTGMDSLVAAVLRHGAGFSINTRQ